MVPLDETWTHEVAIDWKNVIENYVEDYHFPIGHPGLSALMEAQYDRETFPGGTMRLSHRMREKPLRSWSAQGYAKFLPVMEHLPEDMRRRWTYFGLYPNVFFDIYPEWMDFFHVLPLGAGRTLIRARSFGFPDDRREMKAARFLCARLNSPRAGRGRSPDRLRAARARLRRLFAGHPVVEGDRARGLPGLDPRADPGRQAGQAARPPQLGPRSHWNALIPGERFIVSGSHPARRNSSI